MGGQFRGEVQNPVAQRVGFGMDKVGLVVQAEQPGPGVQVRGDVRGQETQPWLTVQALEGRLRRPMALFVRTRSSTPAWARCSASGHCG